MVDERKEGKKVEKGQELFRCHSWDGQDTIPVTLGPLSARHTRVTDCDTHVTHRVRTCKFASCSISINVHLDTLI
jgi:hypothetical protein